MTVTFRKEAGARDKNDTDYRAIAKRLKEAVEAGELTKVH